jgi:hypothetical protein
MTKAGDKRETGDNLRVRGRIRWTNWIPARQGAARASASGDGASNEHAPALCHGGAQAYLAGSLRSPPPCKLAT